MSTMDSMTREIKNNNSTDKNLEKNAVENFMGGVSYKVDALETLKMVTASSIFGEPAYYRDGMNSKKRVSYFSGYSDTHRAVFADYSVFKGIDCFDIYYCLKHFEKESKTNELMEDVIDEALSFNFKAVLEWAVTLRNEFYMRLNPQIIMVRAAMHPDRAEFTKNNPGMFNEINMKVMSRADDVISQVTYFIFKTGDKKQIPGILKRSWAAKVSSLTPYEVNKYKNAGIGLINTVRICHANSESIDELMRTGKLEVAEQDKTWETLRATGMSWAEILGTIRMNHMALLRNLRGIFGEIDDSEEIDKSAGIDKLEEIDKVLADLKKGVLGGKQFPFRYYTAAQAMCFSNLSAEVKTSAMDAIKDCLDISLANLPHLPGNNAFLSDNSGSAWGTFNSEYGSVTIAEIDNLSSVIGAANSDHGTVFKFGDKVVKYPISKRTDILSQANKISADNGREVGHATESGIWLFFEEAIEKGIKYDNIFVYSDMQAGYGELYGTDEDFDKYKKLGYAVRGYYINVPMLIKAYREKVNPKVNVYCVQTAGYDNAIVPDYGYRTNILYGWTGKELVFAAAMNKFWDEYDEKNKKN